MGGCTRWGAVPVAGAVPDRGGGCTRWWGGLTRWEGCTRWEGLYHMRGLYQVGVGRLYHVGSAVQGEWLYQVLSFRY